MEIFIQTVALFDGWSILLSIVDGVGFTLYFVAVAYLLIFAIGSTLRRPTKYKAAKKMHRYAVIFPIHNGHEIILSSLHSFLQQEYPKTHYDLIVVSNHGLKEINQQIRALPVTLMLIDRTTYAKSEAIRFAMATLEPKAYDVAVILDANNSTDLRFLYQINDAYYSGGMAIQTHRVAKNTHSDIALFEAISQEINNSIFRMGHVNLGFSSALIGSGMAFNFDWLQRNMKQGSVTDLEKQLEARLLEQSILIEYLSEVYVYDEKVDKAEEFFEERKRWMDNHVGFHLVLPKFITALFRGNYDFCDKLFQWLLPSRAILFGTLFLIALFFLIFSWTQSLKWWGLLMMLIVAFTMAMPDSMIDARFIKAVKTIPLLFLLMLFNLFRRKAVKIEPKV